MNSERKAFEEWYEKNNDFMINTQFLMEGERYLDRHVRMAWLAWQASAQRKGYKFVPVDKLIEKWEKEAKYREDIASEDWVSNTINECIDDLKSMIGAVDD